MQGYGIFVEVYLLVTESILMFWLTDVVSYSRGHWARMRRIELYETGKAER